MGSISDIGRISYGTDRVAKVAKMAIKNFCQACINIFRDKRAVFVHNYKCANLTQCNMQHVHSPVPHRYRHHHHAHHHRDHAACLHCFTPSWMSPCPRVEEKTITNHKSQITKMSSTWMSPRWRVNVKVHSLPKKHCF